MEHKTKVAEDLELTEAQAQPADVLRLLNVLLSSECRVEEKKRILEEEFAIKVSKQMEEEMAQMCNLSQGIVEKGIAQGIEKGMAQGVEKGAFNATLDSLRRLIANAGMSAEQAMNVLEIPASERKRYLAAMG